MSKKTYFLSDFHLGIDTDLSSRERELKIVRFLDQIKDDVAELYLVGDVFDFWFEYKQVVPKGYIRLFGKLAELADAGVTVHYFIGNHDMWMFDYLKDEIGAIMHREPVMIQLGNKRAWIGHGDGLGPRDHGYKFIKKIFRNRVCQWLFARLHPNFSLALGQYWSGKSRLQEKSPAPFNESTEWLVAYSEEMLKEKPADYYIFGHRHLPIAHLLSNDRSRYINLGEWMYSYSYAVWNGEELRLEFFESEDGEVYGRG